MDATFWVGAAFVVFIGVIIYYKVHTMMATALDDRAAKIRSDIDEARRLHEEARSLLASYQRKQQDAVEEAQGIVAQAETQATREREEAAAKLQQTIERREKSALEKIAMAEQQARHDIRAAAVDIAIAAARDVIQGNIQGEKATSMIDSSIRDVRRLVN